MSKRTLAVFIFALFASAILNLAILNFVEAQVMRGS